MPHYGISPSIPPAHLRLHYFIRHEASVAIAIADHRGDDRQLTFFAGDQISIKVARRSTNPFPYLFAIDAQQR